MSKFLLVSLLFLVLLLPHLALPSAATASDGILEINQACAENTGCFSGDTPGFPVLISQVGSYRLTSNLVLPDEFTDGIVVNRNDVAIDLNHFAIIRAACVSTNANCTPTSGSGSGVRRFVSTNRGISVKNGSITGMGNTGVFLGEQAEVTNLRVRFNRFEGISVTHGSIVSGNLAHQNGDDGINTGNGSKISGNTTYRNGGAGIFAGIGSSISDNTTYDNGGPGISANIGSSVIENTAYSNGGDGIRTVTGSTVQRNNVSYNSEFGLYLGGASYRENSMLGNGAGTVSGGVNAGSNICDDSLTCP